MEPETYLDGVITVEPHLKGFQAFITGIRPASDIGPTRSSAIGALINTHPDLVIKGLSGSNTYVKELQAALQMTADALSNVCAGNPVRNVPHCIAAAEQLLKGTEYELVLG